MSVTDFVKASSIRLKRFTLERMLPEDYDENPVSDLDNTALEFVGEVHMDDVMAQALRTLATCPCLREVHVTSGKRYHTWDSDVDKDLGLVYPALIVLTVDSHLVGDCPIVECEMPALQRLVVSQPVYLQPGDLQRFSGRCGSLAHLDLTVDEVETPLQALSSLVNLQFLRFGGTVWTSITFNDQDIAELARSLTKLEVLLLVFKEATPQGGTMLQPLQITVASLLSLMEHCPSLHKVTLPMALHPIKAPLGMRPVTTITSLCLEPAMLPEEPPCLDVDSDEDVAYEYALERWKKRIRLIARKLAGICPNVSQLEVTEDDGDEPIPGRATESCHQQLAIEFRAIRVQNGRH